MTAKGNGDVVVQLRDGKETLRLDFNAIELVEERLGSSVLEFFTALAGASADEQATQSRKFAQPAVLRRIFYAGMLWQVPDGEQPGFTEQDVGRRMELSRIAEYGQQAIDLLSGAYGLKRDQQATRDALPKRRSRSKAKGGSEKNPTPRRNT